MWYIPFVCLQIFNEDAFEIRHVLVRARFLHRVGDLVVEKAPSQTNESKHAELLGVVGTTRSCMFS